MKKMMPVTPPMIGAVDEFVDSSSLDSVVFEVVGVELSGLSLWEPTQPTRVESLPRTRS